MGVKLGVGVGEPVGVGVGVPVAVGVPVGVGVTVELGVGVGDGSLPYSRTRVSALGFEKLGAVPRAIAPE